MNHSRTLVLGVLAAACLLLASSARAQTPKIYLDVDDITIDPGQTALVSVFIDNVSDSIVAFQMGLTMNRPDIAFFRPLIEKAGTLTEAWNIGINLFGDYDGRVTAGAGAPPNVPAVPPNTSGTLFKLVIEAYCDIPDTLVDRTLYITISPVSTFFSNAQGNLIEPVDRTSGVEVAGLACPYQGDFEPDGFITSVDLGTLIGILYEGQSDTQDPCCPASRADFDCDGFATSVDMALMIDYLFAGAAGPCTPVPGL